MNQTAKKHALIFLVGAVLYLIAVLPFLIYHEGIFFYYGDYNVQQVPFYILAHRAVRNGYFFWNPYVDLGSSMGGAFAFYLWGSPFFWLTIPFPESWLPYMMPFLMALKYGTALLTSFIWIRRHTSTDKGALIGAFLYAFSGFQACNIVFQHFHDATAFFPLFLLALDDLVTKNRRVRFAVVTALMSIINYYFFVGEVIFLAIYYLVRYAPQRGIRESVREIVKIIACGTAGLLLAAFFLIQSIGGVTGNSRLNDLISGYDMVVYPDATTPLAILKSIFMVPDIIAKGTLFTNDSVKNSSLAAYLPCFSISGVLAYFFAKRKKDWEKILLIIMAVMAFIPVLNSLYSALNASYYARWYFMPILLMALMTSQALEAADLSALRKGTFVTLAATGLLMICACLPTKKDGKLVWFSISENMGLLETEIIATVAQLLILAIIVFLIPRFVRKNEDVFGEHIEGKTARGYGPANLLTLMAVVVCCLITTEAVLANGNSLIAKTGGTKWRHQMLETRVELADQETFYRVETDGTSTNYDMVWGYPSLHCFESTVHPSIFTFYRGIGMIRTVESTLPMERIGARTLLSTRYYLENTLVKSKETYEDKGGLNGYEPVRLSDDSYNIYENTNYIPMGFSFDYYMTESNYKLVKRGTISDRILVKDIVLSEEQKERYGHYMEEDDRTAREEMSMEEFSYECRKRAASACTEFSFNRKGFTAKANMNRDNLLFFSVPYDDGFTAYVDGEKVPVERVFNGLMAIPVPEGEHSIRFTYMPKGFPQALLVSFVTAAVLFLCSLSSLRKNKTVLQKTQK